MDPTTARTSEDSASVRNNPSERSHRHDSDDTDMVNSGSNSAAAKVRNVNRSYLYEFLDAFRTDEFKEKFNYKKFNANDFCQWVYKIGDKDDSPDSIKTLFALSDDKRTRHNEKIDEEMKKNTEKGDVISDNSELLKTKSVVDVLATQQVRQILRAALAVHVYSEADHRIYELFNKLFKNGDTSPKYLVGTTFLPLILGRARQRNKIFAMTTPSKIEAILYFHCIQYHVTKKCIVKPNMGNRIGNAIQVLTNAWKRLLDNVKIEKIGALSALMTPYIVYNDSTMMFEVLKSRSDGYSHSNMLTTLEDCSTTTQMNEVSSQAWHRTDAVDAAIRYLVDMFFTHLHELLSTDYLYSANEPDLAKWNEVQKYLLPKNGKALPTVFSQVPDTVADALQVSKPDSVEKPPSPSADHVVVDSDDDVVMKELGGIRKRDGSNEDEQPSKRQKTGPASSAQHTAHVKEEPVNISVRPGRQRAMDDATNDAFSDVLIEMQKTFTMCEEEMTELVDTCLHSQGVNLNKNVDLVLTDPPYNIRKEGNRENSSHDSFSEKDMKDLVDICEQVLKPGGHGIIFCSFSQFEKYRSLLTSLTEQVLDYENDPTGNTYTTTTIFNVEAAPLLFVRGDGHFNNTNRNTFSYTNMVEICVHFWRKGGDPEENKKKIDYKTPSEYGGTLPSWTNVVTNVPVPSGSEVVYIPMEKEEDQYKHRLRPEQKPASLMKYLINKFTNGGDLVIDPCAGTFSTMQACILLDKHRRFAGTDKDSNCACIVEEDMIGLFAKQVQNPKSDLSVEDGMVRQHVQTVCEYNVNKVVRKRASAWDVAPGLVPMQNFPPHIIQALCQYHNEFDLYQFRHLSMNRWGLTQIQRMNNMDPIALRMYEANQYKLVIKKSRINHPHAGVGVFTTKIVKKGELLGYYYGALVYGDIGSKQRLHKRYGTGILSVTSEEFEKWSAKISTYQFVDTNNNKYDGYVAPAPFCVCRYINDPRVVKGERNPPSTNNRRRANVEFQVDKKARCNRDFEKYNVVSVVATTTIPADAELYVSYGDEYNFKEC